MYRFPRTYCENRPEEKVVITLGIRHITFYAWTEKVESVLRDYIAVHDDSGVYRHAQRIIIYDTYAHLMQLLQRCSEVEERITII